jgi:hypothetical protein
MKQSGVVGKGGFLKLYIRGKSSRALEYLLCGHQWKYDELYNDCVYNSVDMSGRGQFIRKNIAPLTGAEVNLLTDETVQKLICYAPP